MTRAAGRASCKGMDISVVIPNFNRHKVLVRAIRSVQAQKFPALEVLVVDDGSTDCSPENLAQGFPGVRVICQCHKGVSAARNTGVLGARGNWIAFLDSDDEWHPDKLQKQAELLQARPDSSVCHTDEIWIRNGVRVNPGNRHAKPEGWIYERCLDLCCVSPSSVLLKKSVLETAGMFDETLPACEDYDLWLRLFHDHPVTLVREPLVIKYGGHADQLSRKYWGMDRFRVRSLVKLLESGVLSDEQAEQTRVVLLRKLSILINGMRKRGRIDEARSYQVLHGKWRLA